MKKWISLILVIIVIAGIFYLTFQKPAQTGSLAEAVRTWLEKIGMSVMQL